MLFLFVLMNLVLMHPCTAGADEFMEEKKETTSYEMDNNIAPSREINDFNEANNIEYILGKIEQTAALVEKSERESILTTAEVEEKYDEIVEILEDLIHSLKTPENIKTFLNIKGVDRIITLTARIKYDRLKLQVLIAIKTLFNVDPTPANITLIPISVVDILLDIFEHHENLALKTHALDILSVWLPNNPQIQARVMKLKGLEPFYDQVSKLDANVIYTLLDLFNRILEEHITVRSDKSVRNVDSYVQKLYQKIGLIERMSTPQVCNGLLNIFELILPFNESNAQFTKLIINLMKNIKPFCLRIYRNKARPVRIFTALRSYFIDTDKMEIFEKLGFNSTEVKMIIEDYTKMVNDNSRNEF